MICRRGLFDTVDFNEMAITKFLGDIDASPLADFWRMDTHEIPASPGAYILASSGEVHFTYPAGNSPIFYIGQSSSLLRRLQEHRRYATQAKEDRRLLLYYPRYEYAAKFGARYCYINTWQGLTPKALEELVLAKFAKRYLSFPVANGAGSWSRIASELASV
jgi:hypothetical protein